MFTLIQRMQVINQDEELMKLMHYVDIFWQKLVFELNKESHPKSVTYDLVDNYKNLMTYLIKKANATNYSENYGENEKIQLIYQRIALHYIRFVYDNNLTLTLYGRLPEDSKQKILFLYILCLLDVEVTEFHLGV